MTCKSPHCFLPSFKSIGLLVQEKKCKIGFQDGSHHPNDLSYFLSTSHPIPMLPIKFQVSWPFSSGGEAKNRFSRWRPWQSSWTSDQNDHIICSCDIMTFLKYCIRPNYCTYSYKRTVRQFRSLRITASVLFVHFFIKALLCCGYQFELH